MMIFKTLLLIAAIFLTTSYAAEKGEPCFPVAKKESSDSEDEIMSAEKGTYTWARHLHEKTIRKARTLGDIFLDHSGGKINYLATLDNFTHTHRKWEKYIDKASASLLQQLGLDRKFEKNRTEKLLIDYVERVEPSNANFKPIKAALDFILLSLYQSRVQFSETAERIRRWSIDDGESVKSLCLIHEMCLLELDRIAKSISLMTKVCKILAEKASAANVQEFTMEKWEDVRMTEEHHQVPELRIEPSQSTIWQKVSTNDHDDVFCLGSRQKARSTLRRVNRANA